MHDEIIFEKDPPRYLNGAPNGSLRRRHGLRQLTYMKVMGMGNNLYEIMDLD